MSSDNTSSLKAYMDSATGAVQSAIGSLTGSTADQARTLNPKPNKSKPHPSSTTTPPPTPLTPHQAKGEQTKSHAAAEKDASHAVGKAGPFAISSSGGVTQDDPNRSEGSWNQTVGSGKEMLGSLIGSEDLKRQGIEQNREGKGQEAQGQLSDLGSGMADRAKGALGSGMAGLTGDKAGQAKYQEMHDQGKTQLRSAQADIQKQGDY
ncbi:hypothetical protein MMC13_001344 [Lambiella insularis]|nr:hypothetical protein [Lambiella insularis]